VEEEEEAMADNRQLTTEEVEGQEAHLLLPQVNHLMEEELNTSHLLLIFLLDMQLEEEVVGEVQRRRTMRDPQVKLLLSMAQV